jgi:hypothetical protein
LQDRPDLFARHCQERALVEDEVEQHRQPMTIAEVLQQLLPLDVRLGQDDRIAAPPRQLLAKVLEPREVTPGIGLAWFAFRREWRQLAIALGATAAVAAVSFGLAPQLWREFVDAMTVQAPAAIDVPPAAIQISLPIRLALALVVVGFGARTDRYWLVPVAATIAAPALWWNVFVILVACVPLLEGRGVTKPLIAPWPVRRAAAPASAGASEASAARA